VSTYRERREARVERLREWADKRETRAGAELEQAEQMREAIPFGQPILVGHHSERRDRNYRDRIHNKTGRALDSLDKARRMSSKADSIEAAAAAAIYSDDVDAVDRLRERVSDLCAQRDRIKAYNKTARAGAPDPGLLDDKQRANLESIARHASWQLGKGGAMPAYVLSNLSGSIKRQRDRLDRLAAAELAAIEGGDRMGGNLPLVIGEGVTS
jgi:hypothetical protein